MASDRDLVSSEDHELNYLLQKWSKRQSIENREKLAEALKTFKEDENYKPHNRENFYKYVDDNNIKDILESIEEKEKKVEIKKDNNLLYKDKNIKTMTGLVVSDKMNKTVVVLVEYKKLHDLYKKYVKKSKKFKAHDEENQCKEGDIVKIANSRPISKEKFWKVVEIIKRAK